MVIALLKAPAWRRLVASALKRRVMSGGASLEEEVTAKLLIELSKRQLAILIEFR